MNAKKILTVVGLTSCSKDDSEEYYDEGMRDAMLCMEQMEHEDDMIKYEAARASYGYSAHYEEVLEEMGEDSDSGGFYCEFSDCYVPTELINYLNHWLFTS